MSCEKILHEEDISIGKIENYDQLVYAAGGVYGELAWVFSPNFIDNHRGIYAANIKGDDLNFGQPHYDYYPTGRRCWNIYAFSIGFMGMNDF